MRSLRVLLGTAALALALTACGDDSSAPTTTEPAGSPAPILRPGAPGDPAGAGGEAVPRDSWTDGDAAFMQMMIPHHGQALVMSDLAADRASSPEVLRLAERIRAAQGPEIIAMASWLDGRDLPVPKAAEDASHWDHAAHGHDGMTGMLTPEQLEELEAADGAAFDRLFLEGMIRHHQGAIDMSTDVARTGSDRQVAELSVDIMSGQQAEIDIMRGLLQEG